MQVSECRDSYSLQTYGICYNEQEKKTFIPVKIREYLVMKSNYF